MILKIFFFLFGFLRAIFYNINKLHQYDIITIVDETSFGHKVTTTDYIVRLFKKNKIFIIFFNYEKTNLVHINLYKNYIKYDLFSPFFNNIKKKYIIYELVGSKFYLNFVLGRAFRGKYLSDPVILYKSLKPNNNYSKYFNYNKQQIIKMDTFYSHKKLINNIHLELTLDKELFLKKIKKIIKLNNPVFFSFLFREDQAKHNNDHDKLRDVGNINHYFQAMKFILKQNINNVLLVKSNLELNIGEEYKNRIITYNENSKDFDLINISSMALSKFCVLQHSGPVHLCNIFKTRIVISDFLPLWQGSAGKDDVFVPKVFFDIIKKKEISLKEIFQNYKGLFYGDYQSYPNIRIDPSKEVDIFDAIKNMYSECVLKIKVKSNVKKNNNYLNLVPKKSIHYLNKNLATKLILEKYF